MSQQTACKITDRYSVEQAEQTSVIILILQSWHYCKYLVDGDAMLYAYMLFCSVLSLFDTICLFLSIIKVFTMAYFHKKHIYAFCWAQAMDRNGHKGKE